MTAVPPATLIEFAPNAAASSNTLQPASAQSVAHFQALLYNPTALANGISVQPVNGGAFLNYIEKMSSRWRAGQDAIEQLSRKGTLSMGELIKVQTELVNATVNVEISSKATGILESSIQSLVQRGQ
ncbi:MAG TPA: hypothetical protein VFS47_01610 [Steroidobacteraceae bacterium]|jgi:hypothetical protein|nr:hypothetical protein [Steroidobacteraceae bacterium]